MLKQLVISNQVFVIFNNWIWTKQRYHGFMSLPRWKWTCSFFLLFLLFFFFFFYQITHLPSKKHVMVKMWRKAPSLWGWPLAYVATLSDNPLSRNVKPSCPKLSLIHFYLKWDTLLPHQEKEVQIESHTGFLWGNSCFGTYKLVICFSFVICRSGSLRVFFFFFESDPKENYQVIQTSRCHASSIMLTYNRFVDYVHIPCGKHDSRVSRDTRLMLCYTSTMRYCYHFQAPMLEHEMVLLFPHDRPYDIFLFPVIAATNRYK